MIKLGRPDKRGREKSKAKRGLEKNIVRKGKLEANVLDGVVSKTGNRE